MNDERARILKLLEDGKITADQAARLIEAMKPRSSEACFVPPIPAVPPIPRRGKFKELERIPDIVANAVASAMKSGIGSDAEGRQVFPGKSALSVKGVSGDVEVKGTEESRVAVEYSGGMARAREEDDSVEVRAVSGDVEAEVPTQSRLELTTVSGDITVEQVNGEALVKTVSGDIDLEDHDGKTDISTISGDVALVGHAGATVVETRSGNIEVEMAGPIEGSAITHSGDVSLSVNSDADLMLKIQADGEEDVELDVQAPHEVQEQSGGYVRLKFGAGIRTFIIRTRSGQVVIQDKEEE